MSETTYDVAVSERRLLEVAMRDEEKRHHAQMRDYGERLALLEKQIRVADAGLCSAEDVRVGQEVLTVQWHHVTWKQPPAEVHMQFAEAIRDLQDGCQQMKHRYFGIKSYDRWASQITNCEYGMGPSHGSIWFRIGLKRPTEAETLTPPTRQACIRYLRAVQADPEKVL